MVRRNSASVTRTDWFIALRALAEHCGDSDGYEAQQRIRELHTLLLVAPDQALIEGLRPLEAARLDLLVQVGAIDTMVLAMLGRGTGYLLSQSGNGECLATIALPHALHEESAAGANPALALVGALALALSNAATTARAASVLDRSCPRPAVH